ncbi:MAG: YceI family protein, partial [Verrucomicrobiota bacterium]
MKTWFWQRSFAALLALVVASTVAFAEEWVRYEGQPGSKIKIDGTSTIHDWSVESQIIKGYMELDTAFDGDLKTMKVKPKVEVTIPVRSLKSGKKLMDNVMHEAMKQTEHPQIEYRLLEMTPKGDGKGPAGPFQYDAKGTLKVSGVTRTNTMTVNMERLDPTKIKVTGVTKLKMTDFGIKPPAPDIGLGLIKTGDDVKITFEWITAQKKDQPKTAQ